MDTVTPPKRTPALRRRNSTATSVLIPSKLSISTVATATATSSSSSSSTSRTTSSSSSSSQSFSTIDFELSSIPNAASYTSLKDLLPSTAVQSPTSSGGGGGSSSGYEISIRNRLVKQAAWAYLQPMSTSPDSVGRSFVNRLWIRFSGDLVNSQVGIFFRHVIRVLTRALDGLLQAIWVRSSR